MKLRDDMDDTVVSHRGFTRGQLSDAFHLICDPDNWKMPFECIISDCDFELYNEACMFFTGAELQVVELLGGDSKCRCIGYYEAIGA